VVPSPRGKVSFQAFPRDNLPESASSQIQQAGQSKTKPTVEHIFNVDVPLGHPNLRELQDWNQERNRTHPDYLLHIQDTPAYQQQERSDPKQSESQLIAKRVERVEENLHIGRSHALGNFGIWFQGEEKDDPQTSDEQKRPKKLRHEMMISRDMQAIGKRRQ
jgi:hypothetical protein